MNKKGTELLAALEHALVSNSARIVLTTGEVWVRQQEPHPMTSQAILELSTKLQRAEDFLNALAMQASHLDPVHKVPQDARYRLALSWVDKTRKDYNDAISSLSADQLERLTKGEEI